MNDETVLKSSRTIGSITADMRCMMWIMAPDPAVTPAILVGVFS